MKPGRSYTRLTTLEVVMFMLLSLLSSFALAQDAVEASVPTIDDVIDAAETGDMEKVKEKVAPTMTVTVEFPEPAAVGFALLSMACEGQETAELAKACAAKLADFEKVYVGAFTDDVQVDALTTRPRPRKGGFVVIVEDENGNLVFPGSR